MNFQPGFIFANTTRKRIFKGLDFAFSTLFPSTFFYAQCSKLEEHFKPFQHNRMVKLLLGYGYTRCKQIYQHTISTILDGQWMVLCWSQFGQLLLKLQEHAWYWSNVDANRSVRSAASVKNMGCLIHNCVCVVVVAWTQSSCWIYGIDLAVQCIGCVSFCIVSCYSTIKVLKNDCWNVPSPIYIVFGHCP